MHPAIVILLSACVRVLALYVAVGRILGLSLSGGGSLFWPHIPAFVLLYFAVTPKPKPGNWQYFVVSIVLFVFAVTSVWSESEKWDAPVWIELMALILSLAAHYLYLLWKKRGPEWGMWQLV